MDISDLKGHVDDATREVRSLIERQSAEVKANGETAADTARKLKEAEERYDSATKDLGDKLDDQEKRLQEAEKSARRIAAGGGEDAMKALSPGEQFVVSKAFREAQEHGRKSVDRVAMESVFEKQGFSPDEMKDLVGDLAASAGALIQPDRDTSIARDVGRRINHVRQVMGTRATDSNTVEFVQHLATGGYPQAAVQAGEGAVKKQEDMSFELKQRAVQTLAHFIPASRQVLEDAAQLRSYIDDELMHGLMLEEDQQVLYGDGTGNNLYGFFNEPVTNVGDRPTDRSYLDHIRRAIRLARESNYVPDAIMVTPADWETIETAKGSDGQYVTAVVQSIVSGAEPTVWRIPVVEMNALQPQDFMLGNFSSAARLWDRRRASVRVSESHASYFTENMVAILAEERLCLTVNRPSAFVKGSFIELV